MHFHFNPFSVRSRFYDIPSYFHTYMCTHVLDACAIVILCKYILPSFAEVKVLKQQNMLSVNHMHTLVCEILKWNYEQNLYTHTFITMVNSFARLDVPLTRPFVLWKMLILIEAL